MFKRVWGGLFRAGADMCLASVTEKTPDWEEENRSRWLITIQTRRLWGRRREEPGCNSDNPN